jgi:beta-lactamase regulating signal transducer with metallopeptidase domain
MNIAGLPSQTLAVFLLNVAWQAAALLGIALVVERLVRRHATARHAVLLCGLVAALAVPAVVLVEQRLGVEVISWPKATPTHQAELRLAFVEADLKLDQQGLPLLPPIEAGSDRTSLLTFAEALNLAVISLLAIWLAGSLVYFVRYATAWWALRKLCFAARPASGQVFDSALQMVRQLHPGAIPSVLVSDQLRTPLSAGLFHPYVLLPRFALDSYSADGLCGVLLHEFAHAQRHDIAVVYLQRFASILFWAIPLLHRLNRLLDEAREDICDNYVIAVRDPLEYSRILLEFSRTAFAFDSASPSTGLLSGKRTLEERIKGLLDAERRPLTRLRSAAAVMIVSFFAAVAICLGALQVPAVASDSAQNASSILDRGIEASNGPEALKKLEVVSWKFSGKVYGPSGAASISGRCFRQGGDQFRCETRFEMEGVKADSIEVISRSEGWVKTRTGQVSAIGDEESFAHTKVNRLYLQWITTLVPLRAKPYTLTTARDIEIGKREARGILVQRDSYSDAVLYFDKETALLVKSEMRVKVTRGADHELGKVLVQETFYDDYREFDGVRVPSRITIHLDGKMRRTVTITDLKTHARVDNSLFEKP